MTSRRAVVFTLVASVGALSIAATSFAQPTPDEGVRGLLLRLERLVQAGDIRGYNALLSESADTKGAAGFTSTELASGATRVVLREREREPLVGTLPGNGYRLSVDVFTEFGDRARSATWRLDLKRVGTRSDDTWVIADQQRVSVVENLYRLSLSSTKQFDARHLTISVDDFDLALPEGTIFPVEIDQGTTGFVLLGRGEIRFHPAPEIERGQLKIFCGAEALQARFDAAFIRVNPADAARFVQSESLTPRSVDPRDARRAEDVFREEVSKSFAVDLSDLSRELWSLVPATGDFLAEVRTQRFDTLTYSKSGAEAEDLSFYDRKRHKNISVYASPQALARYGGSYNEDDLATFDVLDYDIDLEMSPDRLWLDGRTTMHMRVAAIATNSLTIRLANSLVVQSIVSDRFGRLFGVRVRNQDLIVVNLPSVVLRDGDLALTIKYAGRLEPQREDAEAAAQGPPRPQQNPDDAPVVQREPSFLYSNRSYWYPQGTVTDYATARIRMTIPAGYDCVASGELSEGFPTALEAKESVAARKVYAFTAAQPLRYLAFVVSRFVRPEIAGSQPGAHVKLAVRANSRQARRGRELGEQARDIAQFYESLIGDAPYPSFTIAVVEGDLPGGHSPAYFAVVRQPVPQTPVIWRNDPASFENYPEFFLAHELAHQWWGQAVGWRNYHEQWVSEGFAQYFAALYAQRRRGDDTFISMLRQFRRWGMKESDQGPIYLGYRLGHLRSDGRVFRALVYNKSAAVLHMLRRLLGDEAFFRGVRRFYEASRFRKVGTDDFRAIMEIEAGRSLERFFERWIHGSTLPRLKWSYRVEPADAGEQLVLHVEQVGEIFDVPLTVTLLYTGRKDAQLVIPITERIVEFRAALAGSLRGVEISRDDGMLAEIVKN